MAVMPEIDIGECLDRSAITMHVTVKGLRWFKFRLRIGTALIRLGAWLAGVGCSVKDEEAEPEWLTRVQAVRFGKGDTIVLRTSEALRHETMDNIRRGMREQFPENKCIVLERGMEIGVLLARGDE